MEAMTHTEKKKTRGTHGVMSDGKTKTANLFGHFGEHLGHDEEVA